MDSHRVSNRAAGSIGASLRAAVATGCFADGELRAPKCLSGQISGASVCYSTVLALVVESGVAFQWVGQKVGFSPNKYASNCDIDL